MFFKRNKTITLTSDDALPGRDRYAFDIPSRHAVLGTPIQPPFPEEIETAAFALGCFWGAERLFWRLPGVYTTAVGYTGGVTPYPTYEEACSGHTGHSEAVLVAFDHTKITYESLLKTFFEEHNPTQGMRQGNDVGTQYRSAIYYANDEQRRMAEAALESYDSAVQAAGFSAITTEIAPAGPFYYAEGYHQQYLHKIPNGYCGLKGTGVSCSMSEAKQDDETPRPLPENEDEWRSCLTPEQYSVLRQAGTERAFTGEYVDTVDDGIYRCRACGNLLFDSNKKFHSGSGWPSFTEALSSEAVELIDDGSHGMVRTEVRCGRCHSHLGHVFDDGPREKGGERWCMNSVALDLTKR